MAWNSLPGFIRDPTSSTDCFRRLLKTYLFARNWCIRRISNSFRPGELYHDSYTCKISILKVQKLQRKETNGRTRPIASLSPITRSVITQCFLTRPMALMRPHAKLLWRFVLYFACMFDLCQCHYMHLSNSMYIIPTFPYLGSGITEDGECIGLYTAEFRTRLEGRRSGHHCRKYGKVIAYRFR